MSTPAISHDPPPPRPSLRIYEWLRVVQARCRGRERSAASVAGASTSVNGASRPSIRVVGGVWRLRSGSLTSARARERQRPRRENATTRTDRVGTSPAIDAEERARGLFAPSRARSGARRGLGRVLLSMSFRAAGSRRCPRVAGTGLGRAVPSCATRRVGRPSRRPARRLVRLAAGDRSSTSWDAPWSDLAQVAPAEREPEELSRGPRARVRAAPRSA